LCYKLKLTINLWNLAVQNEDNNIKTFASITLCNSG